MVKCRFFTFLIFSFFMIYINSYLEGRECVVYVTMPKCGTHLVKQILKEVLTYDEYNSVDWIDNHLVPSMEIYKNQSEIKKIVVIRDLRDMCISASYWLLQHDWWSTEMDHTEFYRRDHQGQIDYFIDLDHKDYSIGAFARRAAEWIRSPNTFLIRFEEIVGEAGGGSREKQIEIIDSLLKFLNFEVAKKRIESIADHSFGKGVAFRKGTIGQWKEEFSDFQIERFKKNLGEELISLGYEKDLNWSNQ